MTKRACALTLILAVLALVPVRAFAQSGLPGYAVVTDTTGTTLLAPAGSYYDFGPTAGANGYGFRDNNGTLEMKNRLGAWASVATIGGGTGNIIPGTDATYTLGSLTGPKRWASIIGGLGYFSETATTAPTGSYTNTLLSVVPNETNYQIGSLNQTYSTDTDNAFQVYQKDNGDVEFYGPEAFTFLSSSTFYGTVAISDAQERRINLIPTDPSAALFGATLAQYANVGGDSGGRANSKLSWGYNPGAENSITPTSAEPDVSWNVESFYNPSAGLAQQEQYFVMGASHYRWLMLIYRTIGVNETTGVPAAFMNLPIIHFTNQDVATDYATLSTAGFSMISGPINAYNGIAGYSGGARTYFSDTGGFATMWMHSPGATDWQMQYESGVGTKINTPTGEGIQFKINNVVKAAMTSDGKFGGLLLTTPVTAASSGTRYLCISTTGAVTSSATACSGT